MKLVIGVTGGVGAGKSAVLEILKKDFDACVMPSDDIGRQVCEPTGAAYGPLVQLFGPEVLNEDRTLDRPYMARQGFGNPQLLAEMNKIIHPAVKDVILQTIQDGPEGIYVVESAILYEAKYDSFCDEVWYIHADESVRIERIMTTRGYTREKSAQVIARQLSDEEFRKRCDYIVENNGDLEKTRQQVGERIRELTATDEPRIYDSYKRGKLI